MNATLFTDAGYCPKRDVAVWAAWCRSDLGVIRRSGIFRAAPPDRSIVLVETWAIVNGVWTILTEWGGAVDAIDVRSDSSSAIDFLAGRAKVKAAHGAWGVEMAAAKGRFDRYTATVHRVGLLHVKGHRGTRNVQAAVNTWCDEECTRRLAEARAAAVIRHIESRGEPT